MGPIEFQIIIMEMLMFEDLLLVINLTTNNRLAALPPTILSSLAEPLENCS
jgi:hypothetical protein